jgi:hypothetical protein
MPILGDESTQLVRLIGTMISRAPQLLIRALIQGMRPRLSPNVDRFLEALIARLELGGNGAPSVTGICARARLKPWVVRRECRRERLPAPERFIEWLTFIYVIAMAEWEHISIARAADMAGQSAKYIRSLRSALLRDTPRLTGALAGDALVSSIIQLAQACGVEYTQAKSEARRLTLCADFPSWSATLESF